MSIGKLTKVEGEVAIIRNGKEQVANIGDDIFVNDVISTKQNAVAIVAMPAIKAGQTSSVATVKNGTIATFVEQGDKVVVNVSNTSNVLEIASVEECDDVIAGAPVYDEEKDDSLIAGAAGFDFDATTAALLVGGGILLAALSKDNDSTSAAMSQQNNPMVMPPVVPPIVNDRPVTNPSIDIDKDKSVVDNVLDNVIVNDRDKDNNRDKDKNDNNRDKDKINGRDKNEDSSLVNDLLEEDSELESLLEELIGIDSALNVLLNKTINVDLSKIDSELSELSPNFSSDGLAGIVDSFGDALALSTGNKGLLNSVTDDVVEPLTDVLSKVVAELSDKLVNAGDKSFVEPLTDTLGVVLSGPSQISSNSSNEQTNNPLNFIC